MKLKKIDVKKIEEIIIQIRYLAEKYYNPNDMDLYDDLSDAADHLDEIELLDYQGNNPLPENNPEILQ